jgi:hypothetical protein
LSFECDRCYEDAFAAPMATPRQRLLQEGGITVPNLKALALVETPLPAGNTRNPRYSVWNRGEDWRHFPMLGKVFHLMRRAKADIQSAVGWQLRRFRETAKESHGGDQEMKELTGNVCPFFFSLSALSLMPKSGHQQPPSVSTTAAEATPPLFDPVST